MAAAPEVGWVVSSPGCWLFLFVFIFVVPSCDSIPKQQFKLVSVVVAGWPVSEPCMPPTTAGVPRCSSPTPLNYIYIIVSLG